MSKRNKQSLKNRQPLSILSLVLSKLIVCPSVTFEELSQLTLVVGNTLLLEALRFLQFWCPCLHQNEIIFVIKKSC